MSAPTAIPWQHANQRYLSAHLARVRNMLIRHAGEAATGLVDDTTSAEVPAIQHAYPAALDQLCAIFALSAFERDVVLLCAGFELEAAFAALCAAGHGDPQRNYPSFGLALAALAGASWAALAPHAPLRRWGLVQIEQSRALTRSPLRLDERVLHYLIGTQHLDEQLVGIVRPISTPDSLAPSHVTQAEQLAATIAHAMRTGERQAIQLCGPRVENKRSVAAAACGLVGLNLMRMSAMAVPSHPVELERLLLRWEREAALSDSALLLDCDTFEATDTLRESALAQFVDGMRGLLFVSSRERGGPWQRPLLAFDVGRSTPAEQRQVWESVLGDRAASLNGQLDRLAAQFDLDTETIELASSAALGRLDNGDVQEKSIGSLLWDTCLIQSRPKLENLAQRIEVAASWNDLVLPERQREVLGEIALHLRQRGKVYGTWGFAGKSSRGLGISALFAGPSGTGKTTAAEVLARDLRLDLYRIDLSSVVSKYIGETEKNLRQVFDAAEGCGAILLFDEADALFGKRSDVKDSHDRHANIEVSYLLQRMEQYQGLAILTTNLKDSLDDAFLRRIRFVVQFPFPDAAQRAEIWRRVFPASTPTEGLDAEQLARLNVAGGNIRNIALNAAFLAADADEPVRMSHLLHAARREYTKLERTLTDAEVRGWQ
jgi:hypothetical protein